MIYNIPVARRYIGMNTTEKGNSHSEGLLRPLFQFKFQELYAQMYPCRLDVGTSFRFPCAELVDTAKNDYRV